MLLNLLGVALVYVVLTMLTRQYLIAFGSANGFYLANGFSLAVLVIGGIESIWGVGLGALLAAQLLGYPLGLGAITAIGSCLGVLCSYLLVTGNKRFNKTLPSWFDYSWLLAGAAIGSGLSALIALIVSWLTGMQAVENLFMLFFSGWMANLLGFVLLASVILVLWPVQVEQLLVELPIESISTIALSFFMGQAIIWNWLPVVFGQEMNSYWIFPFIAWVVIRLGIKEMVVMLALWAVQVLSNIHQDFNFPHTLANAESIQYGFYLLAVSVTSMALIFFTKTQQRENDLLFEQEEFFRMIAERTEDMIAVLDLNGRRIYNSVSYRKLFGDMERLKGTNCFNEIHTEDRDRIKRVFSDTVHFGIGQWTEFRFVLADGSTRHMESRGELLRNKAGQAKWVVVVSRDITDQKRIEENYRIANIAFESQDGMFITDVKNIILRVNRAFSDITGYSAEDVIGKTSYFLRSTRQIEGLDNAINDSLNRVGAWRGEVWSCRKNGEEYLEQHTITVVRDDKGNITHFLTLLEDITLRKLDEEKIKQLAFHDPLTHLANRRKLLDRLRHGLAIGKRENQKMALLMIDIDRFKAINDIFGTDAGDELLQQMAVKLKGILRDMDLIARFGSDEFIIFLENISSVESVSRIAESIIFDLSQPFNLTRGHDVKIGVNIGISLYPQHADSAEMLLEQADVALYQAKDAGRGGYRYFSENFIRTL